MKIIKKLETNTFQNNDQCRAIEYPLGDPDLSGAVIHINGRYPEQNTVVNTVCKELAYVIQGAGVFVSNNVTTQIAEGDLLIIYPGDEYYWEGNLVLFEANTPAWHPEQHQLVDPSTSSE